MICDPIVIDHTQVYTWYFVDMTASTLFMNNNNNNNTNNNNNDNNNNNTIYLQLAEGIAKANKGQHILKEGYKKLQLQ